MKQTSPRKGGTKSGKKNSYKRRLEKYPGHSFTQGRGREEWAVFLFPSSLSLSLSSFTHSAPRGHPAPGGHKEGKMLQPASKAWWWTSPPPTTSTGVCACGTGAPWEEEEKAFPKESPGLSLQRRNRVGGREETGVLGKAATVCKSRGCSGSCWERGGVVVRWKVPQRLKCDR